MQKINPLLDNAIVTTIVAFKKYSCKRAFALLMRNIFGENFSARCNLIITENLLDA